MGFFRQKISSTYSKDEIAHRDGKYIQHWTFIDRILSTGIVYIEDRSPYAGTLP